MNALEEFYLKLDENGWDAKQEGEINVQLLKVSEKLLKDNLLDIQHFAEVDRQAFLFSKTPEKRLSYRYSGTKQIEDGSEIPIVWPDINEFGDKDFDYLYTRFKLSKNIYAKTEYGLVLYYSKKKQDNDFIIELLNALFELLKSYIEKDKSKEDKSHYIVYAYAILANTFHIANNRKELIGISDFYKSLIEYTFQIHQNWDVTYSSALRVIIDFTNFSIDYVYDFKNYVDVKKFLDKNWEAAKYLSESYVWGAIYVSDISIRLSRKLNVETKDWFFFKAKQYEKLYHEAIDRNNLLAAVSFIEKAMEIYKENKDAENLTMIKRLYQETRNKSELKEIKLELSTDENELISETIKKEISEFTSEEIMQMLLFTPIIRPLFEIRKESEESFNVPNLSNILPTNILDKFGNTIARMIYYSNNLNDSLNETNNKNNEEIQQKIRNSLLYRTYGFHIQIATQIIVMYFIEGFNVGKISEETFINYLKQTWIGKEQVRTIFGREIQISFLKLVESGINSFFRELKHWKNEPDYLPDFICSTDSLILKAEYLLREFSYSLGIPTFLPSQESGVIMEKTLDIILRDLEKNLSEDDYFFIKYVLIAKPGYNLRNKIAHGLMDNIEYGLNHPILALIIILKLSNYEFIKN